MSRGIIGIAILQALLAGIGLLFAGVPAAGLFSFVVLLLGIVQIGPSVVLVPLIIWSWFAMDATAAILFTCYMVPVNLIDNIMRPLVAKGLTTPMPVILVVLGGKALLHAEITRVRSLSQSVIKPARTRDSRARDEKWGFICSIWSGVQFAKNLWAWATAGA